MSAQPGSAPKAFISYKWEGDKVKAWVETFAHDLRSNAVDAFLDVWEVGYGDSFIKYMTRNIPQADIFFFIMTPESIKAVEAEEGQGGAVSFEVEMATALKIEGGKTRVIPILLSGDKPAAFLRHYRYVDFRDAAKYADTLAGLIADVTGRKMKPPLLGAGALEYEVRLYRMIGAVETNPLQALLAQTEPYGGFPFFSRRSDHPTSWPPRVYEDRRTFTKRLVEFASAPANAQDIARAVAATQTRVERVSSAPETPDERSINEMVQTYSVLRSLFHFELHGDETRLRDLLGERATGEFLRLEGYRKADDLGMPNRLLTIAFKHSHGRELKDVAIDLQLVGTIYDTLLDGRRLVELDALEDVTRLRTVLHTGPIAGTVTSILRIWYDYVSLNERSFPDPIHFEGEPHQGVLLYRIGTDAIESEEKPGLIEDQGVYEEYPTGVIAASA